MTTDRHGWEIDEYPDEHDEYGRLLGINLFGNAAYATPKRVYLAELTASGTLRAPPREHWTGHDFPLGDLEMSVGEYLRGVADDYGPWRALSAFGQERVTAANVDTDAVIRRTVDLPRRDAAALVDAVVDGDWAARSDASGPLRMLAMDDPDSVAPHVADLVSLLDDVRGERERIDTEADAPVGSQPFDERTSNTARIAVRQDIAFVITRVGRADPTAVGESLRRLVDIAGDRPYYDPETAYKRYLVDLIDDLGRRDPSSVAAVVTASLAEDEPVVRRRALNTLCNLQSRDVDAVHPVLATGDLSDAVEECRHDENDRLRTAAADLDSLREFHPQ